MAIAGVTASPIPCRQSARHKQRLTNKFYDLHMESVLDSLPCWISLVLQIKMPASGCRTEKALLIDRYGPDITKRNFKDKIDSTAKTSPFQREGERNEFPE
jgi:hypothetical protein